MRVLFVNHTCGIGSTGRICTDIAKDYKKKGHECIIAYGRGKVPEGFRGISKRIGSNIDLFFHLICTRLFDNHGFGSKHATRKFLKWADAYNPDLLWLHNIHGYYINIQLLFNWIKSRPNMKVKWTLHDCWSFTGHCTNFSYVGCEKWRRNCESCPEKKEYPKSILKDNSKKNFLLKKEAFTGISNITIITPSEWLSNYVKESFLSSYLIKVENTKVDTSIFKPTFSNFRQKYGIADKKVVLGVANVWQQRKGLFDILRIYHMLNESHAIVLVGLTNGQIRKINRYKNVAISKYKINSIVINNKAIRLHNGVIISPNVNNLYFEITRTQFKEFPTKKAKLVLLRKIKSREELAGIYSMADLFINPTREDNYPTVNLEAQACGTFVISYNTGGAKETLEQRYYK